MGLLKKLFGGDSGDKSENVIREFSQPFIDAGKGNMGLGGLADLFSGKVDLFAQPGVAKTFDSGAEAIQRRLAAQGFRGSGNELLALADYTGNFTRNLYNDFFNQRLGVAQLGANTAAGAGSSISQAYSAAGQNMAAGFGSLMDLVGTAGGFFMKPPGTK